MIKRNFVFGIIILAVVLITAGGIFYLNGKPADSSQEQFYKISSLVSYDSSLCGGIGYFYKPNGFNSGIKLILKDKITGELIQGRAETSSKDSGGSIGSEEYSCEEGIDSEKVFVSAYAKGYTPAGFIFKYPKNQMASLEISMIKSCSSGPSYFDNLKLSAEMMDNRTFADNYIKEGQDNVYETIKNQFGLEKTDYTLQCIERDNGRGGYIKAKGTYKDGSPLELYYRGGWCSSGGSDCGRSMCFSSSSGSLFESVKNNYCSKVSSRQSHDEYICTSEAYDKTEEVRNKCSSGEFEKTDGNKKILSIIQNSGRCADYVSAGIFNCLEN